MVKKYSAWFADNASKYGSMHKATGVSEFLRFVTVCWFCCVALWVVTLFHGYLQIVLATKIIQLGYQDYPRDETRWYQLFIVFALTSFHLLTGCAFDHCCICSAWRLHMWFWCPSVMTMIGLTWSYFLRVFGVVRLCPILAMPRNGTDCFVFKTVPFLFGYCSRPLG